MFDLEVVDRVWIETNTGSINGERGGMLSRNSNRHVDSLAYNDLIELSEGRLKLIFPFSNAAEELNHIVFGVGYSIESNYSLEVLLRLKAKNGESTRIINHIPLPYTIDMDSAIAYCPDLNDCPIDLVSQITGKNQIAICSDSNQAVVSPNLYNKEIKISALTIYPRWIEKTKEKLERVIVNFVGKNQRGQAELVELEGALVVEPEVSLYLPTRTVWLEDLVEIGRTVLN